MGGPDLGPEPLTLDLLAELDDESFEALFCVIGRIQGEDSRVWDQQARCVDT
jgi:hypothetical protein